jgi:hypothetical protein
MKKAAALVLLPLLAAAACAAPAPWGIAVNSGRGECAGYWAGDEYVAYGLPEGWEAHMPDYSAGGKITTASGACILKNGGEEDCCRQLGLKYVGKNIGSDDRKTLRERPGSGTPTWAWLACGGALALAFAFAALAAAAAVLLGRRKK